MVCSDGSRYQGQTLEGSPHGYGQHYSGGRLYQGQWEHGKRHGHGVHAWPDGIVAAGQYADHHPHGMHLVTLQDGTEIPRHYSSNFAVLPW